MKKLQKNMIRYKIMEKHIELTRKGKYNQAKKLFCLLREKSLYLGLDDDSYEVESFLESIRLKPRYTRNYYTSVFMLR